MAKKPVKQANRGWHDFCKAVGVMKKTANRKGSVLMEYLVILAFVGVVLMAASARYFYSYVSQDYAGDPRIDPKGFGEWGQKFVGFYQRTSGGLSLPVP